MQGVAARTEPESLALTQSGSALGTPSYMAPEQRSNPSAVDQQADIYSLGVVFHEMLTGELPSGTISPPSRKTPMDPRVDELVLRALARQKEDRYRTAAEIRTCVWITMFVWCRRAWFTVALRRMPVLNAGPVSMAEPLLILAWKGVLAQCAVSVLWGVFGQVIMMAQMTRLLPNLPYPPGLTLLYFTDACLSPVLLSIALAVLLVRRELRRQETFFTPATAPAWMPRVAFLFVLFAVVSSLPHAIRGHV